MNRGDFIKAVANKCEGVDEKTISRVVNAYHDVVAETLASGDSLTFIGFGTYKTVDKPARTARNPKTGETINVDAKTVAKFSPGRKLADAVNTPK